MIEWRLAHGGDVAAIVQMAVRGFQSEIDQIFQPDTVAYSRNVTLAVIRQFYGPQSELFSVAYEGDRLVAYVWAGRNERAPWSDDEMVVVRMAHVDLGLPIRTRIRLVQDMINLWEQWALLCQVPIVCSSTVRADQAGFLRIHAQAGYDVRGSYAYKRMKL